MNNHTIAFIGAGNMAASLIGGLVADGYDPKKLWGSNPLQESLDNLRKEYAIHTTGDNLEAARQADIVVLAVKPQVLAEVAKELASVIAEKKPLVVSIVTGIREQNLRQWLGAEVAIVRCMPNTPALVRNGATGLFANQYVSDQQKDLAESILRAVGITLWLEHEEQLDIVTALSGSGPAYFFLVMEALADAAQQQGLDESTARLLTMQTALGAAHMAMQVEKGFAELREQVTSPGGTTEQAIKVLEAGKVRDVFAKALQAARDRSIELADILGDS